MTRVKIADFGIIQKVFANAVVTFYISDSNGGNTGIKATIFQASTGTPSRENPQTLDADGKLSSDCYIETAVIGAITGVSSMTERSIKKVRQNPLEFSMALTDSSFYRQAAGDIYGDIAAVQAAAALSTANASLTAADRVQTGLDVASTVANATASAVQAATAITQAGIATTQATSAATSATNSSTSASTATTQAGISTASATTATTQAGISTAQAVIATAQAVIASAAALSAASNLTATSTTSNTIGTGSFTFSTQANKNFFPGQFIIAASAANGANYIHGQVTSYSGTTLIITESDHQGTGAHTDWNISASSPQGTSGSGAGTVTTASVATANGFGGTVSNPTTTPAITITTSITGIIKGNGTAISAATAGTDYVAPSGALGTPASGNLTNCTFPTLNQNTSGSAAKLSISGQTGLLTFTGLASTNRIKTVGDTADTILELAGSYAPTGTWTNMVLVTPNCGTPSAIVLTNASGSPTFTKVTANLFVEVVNAVTVTTNAGTCSAAFNVNKFVNSSAATMAITLSTSGAVADQKMIVDVLDFSAVTQTIGWTNTENSLVSVPTTSNGSTTLPLKVGFIFNGATSLWRCVAVA